MFDLTIQIYDERIFLKLCMIQIIIIIKIIIKNRTILEMHCGIIDISRN